jgi:hypothetical protein
VNKRKVALGPGAASLILIVVVLSMCMLAMLAQVGVRSDYSLSSRSTEMITKVYELHDKSERRMAELDAIVVRCAKEQTDRQAFLDLVKKNLPEDMSLEGDIVSWTEPLDNRTMNCEVQILDPAETPRTKWVNYRLKVDEPEEDWEW